FLSPHPGPLPWGEGEPFSPRRTIQTRWLSTGRCALFPLPEGEYVFSAQTRRGPGARDLSRRNAGTADPRWRISRPLRYPTFLRTEVRAPFARAATTLNRYDAGSTLGPWKAHFRNPRIVRGFRWSLRIMRFVQSQNHAAIFFSQGATNWRNSRLGEQTRHDGPLVDDGALDSAWLHHSCPGPVRQRGHEL